MLNELKSVPNSRDHKSKRVGRGFGSGIGGRSTRGTKGQKARKSGHVRPGFEGGQTPLYRKVGKYGFSNAPFKKDVTVVTLRQLNQTPEIKEFTTETLIKLGFIDKRTTFYKVIGDNEIHECQVYAHGFSRNAEQIINKKGTAHFIKKPEKIVNQGNRKENSFSKKPFNNKKPSNKVFSPKKRTSSIKTNN